MSKTAWYLTASAIILCLAYLPFNSAQMAAQEVSAPVPAAPGVAADANPEKNIIAVPENSPIRGRLVIETPKAEQVKATFSAPAVVEADPARYARIYPPLSGRVMELNVCLGDRVSEGQPLVAIDSPEFNEAQGDFLKAKSALELAGKTLARLNLLFEHGVAAQKDVEQAKSDHDVARNELERAQTRLQMYTQSAEHKLGAPVVVKSPISGTVVELSVSRGEFRNDAATEMMTVADLSTVWLTANVQEKDIRNVRKDGEVTAVLAAYPDDSFSGRVLFIGDILDADTRCIKARIAFPNPECRLKPGMFATATFQCAAESVITVPNTAVFQVDGAPRVFVELAPWTFEPREIRAGAQTSDRTIILAGLLASDRIVAREGSLLQ
jgi:cobalt-zinc-cadmium efflux system membrane fusion protein